MRVLVTGRSGQLARALAECNSPGVELAFTGRPDLDLADGQSIAAAVVSFRPDLIINAAAYTAVDEAEDELELALRINSRAPALLAAQARRAGARLIHISTDYVFDGSSEVPYTEDMPVQPIGAYGRTKLAGEEAVRAQLAEHVIIRTSWVYSPFGKNFVTTMLALAKERDEVRVVEDQRGNPTSALDLAVGLVAMIERWRKDPSIGLGEVFHLTGTGDTNWADFARAIFACSAARGGPAAAVQGIPSSCWPTKAQRPVNSRLDSTKFETCFGYRMPHWKQSLNEVLDRLLERI